MSAQLSDVSQTAVRRHRDPLGCAFMLLLGAAIVAFALTVQLIGWMAGPMGLGQFVPLSDGALMAWASVVQSVALGGPLLLLGLLWRGPRYRAIFRAWLLATGFALILAPTRDVRPTAPQTAMMWQIAATALFVLFAWRVVRCKPAAGATPSSLWLALAFGLLFVWPWLAWGALGSPLDTVLGLLLSAGFGLLAALLAGGLWPAALERNPGSVGWDLLVGGLATGVTLFIMASGAGFNGSQIVLMLYLPSAGWIAMGLALVGRAGEFQKNWPALALFITLLAAGPLLFVDSDPMYFPMVLATGEAIRWAAKSLVICWVIAWPLTLVLLAWRRHLCSWRQAGPASLAAAVALLLAGFIYVIAGQPGFYGDRLFVILKDQADVSAAANIGDYEARRRTVYETLVKHADVTQAGLRAQLDALRVHYTPYYLVNALEVEGGPLHRLWLESRPEVARVIASPTLRPLPSPVSPESGEDPPPEGPLWNVTLIGADRVWAEWGVRGRGVVIGQSDSGVQGDHPELAGTYRGRDSGDDYNWFDPWFGSSRPTDFGGHGTHTLGSIVGRTTGVAPEAEWYACANLARNLGSPAKYLDCMQFMLAPFPQGGDPFLDGDPTRSAHVINNSWGCPEDREGCDAASLEPAVRSLRAAGIFVVAAAGNEGPKCGTVKDPIALYDEAFSVGAIDRLGNVAEFSSMGPVIADGSGRIKPDIVAPGVDVLSATPGNTYGTASGTSMAGPHVAGVVALMWSANPALVGDIERTEQILIAAARPYTGTTTFNGMVQSLRRTKDVPVLPAAETPELPFKLENCLDETDFAVRPNNVVGYGVVNAYAAVKMALEARDRR